MKNKKIKDLECRTCSSELSSCLARPASSYCLIATHIKCPNCKTELRECENIKADFTCPACLINYELHNGKLYDVFIGGVERHPF